MKFNKGDRVAFLNETQKGVVKEVLNNNKIIVEIEEGFELEVYANELVVQNKTTEKPVSEPEQMLPVDNVDLIKPDELCPPDTICFVALPSANNPVLTGDITYSISNKTQFQLIYTLYSIKNKETAGVKSGIIGSMCSEQVLSIKREDLTEYIQFRFESLLFHEGEIPLVNHIKKDIPLLIPDIKSAEKTINGSVTFGKNIILFDNRQPDPEQIKDLVLKLNTSKNKPKKESNFTTKSNYRPGDYGIHIIEKEVDLHIEELESNISDLTNSEMLQIQLQKFNSEMNRAINSNYKKIVFIHGVGNGVLKNAIRQELKQYSGIQIKDGDPNKFGSGATEVVF